MECPPESEGRTFLAKAFAFLCALEFGLSGEEIEAALWNAPSGDRSDAAQVMYTIRSIGRTFMDGRVETYVRPFGGGAPTLLPRQAWELDDFSNRFATSAMDPVRPFSPTAAPTHWIFVNTSQFNELLGLLDGSAASISMASATKATPLASEGDRSPTDDVAAPRPSGRYIRKGEVLSLVPFSRSTLDARVREGTFPACVDFGGGMVAWRESEVLAWLESRPRREGKP